MFRYLLSGQADLIYSLFCFKLRGILSFGAFTKVGAWDEFKINFTIRSDFIVFSIYVI